jgi:hypothetical protein
MEPTTSIDLATATAVDAVARQIATSAHSSRFITRPQPTFGSRASSSLGRIAESAVSA